MPESLVWMANILLQYWNFIGWDLAVWLGPWDNAVIEQWKWQQAEDVTHIASLLNCKASQIMKFYTIPFETPQRIKPACNSFFHLLIAGLGCMDS